MSVTRPLIAELDINALQHNIKQVRLCAPNSHIMSMVKANAYGHGLISIAKGLADLTDAFGLASLEEAILLREAGINNAIFLLEGVFFKTRN